MPISKGETSKAISLNSKNKKDARVERGSSKSGLNPLNPLNLSPKDYEAWVAHRKELKVRKPPKTSLLNQVKRAMVEDYTVPDPDMKRIREGGRYLASADPEQFSDIISTGPLSHFDDQLIMGMAGFVDEYTWRQADNIADGLYVIWNLVSEGSTPQLGDKIREFRKEVMPKWGQAEAGRWIANLLPFGSKSKWTDPLGEGVLKLFGVAGLLTAKFGPRQTMNIVKKAGELAERFPEKQGMDLFLEAASSIGLSAKDAKWARAFHKAALIANSRAAKGAAQQYGYEIGAQDTFAPTPGSILFAGGMGAGISGVGGLFKVIKRNKQKSIAKIIKDAEDAHIPLNLDKESGKVLQELQDVAVTANKPEILEMFKDKVQELYRKMRLQDKIASQTLVSNVRDIPVQHVEDIINEHKLRLLKPYLDDDDFAILTVMLETNSNPDLIRKMIKENKVIETFEEVIAGEKPDKSAYLAFKDRVKTWSTKKKQIGEYTTSKFDPKQNIYSLPGGIKGRLVKTPVKKTFLKAGDTIEAEIRRVQELIERKYEGGGAGAGLAAALGKLNEIKDSLKIHKDQYKAAYGDVTQIKTTPKKGWSPPKLKKLEKDADILPWTRSFVNRQTIERTAPTGRPPIEGPAISEVEFKALKNMANDASSWNQATQTSIGPAEAGNFMRIFRDLERDLSAVLKTGIKNSAGEFIKNPASEEYRKALALSSKIKRVLFGDPRFKESGVLADSDLDVKGFDGNEATLGYNDAQNGYTYITDNLFRDLGTESKRTIGSLGVSVDRSIEGVDPAISKVYRVAERVTDPKKGRQVINPKTDEIEYERLSGGSDSKTRSFLSFLNILQDEGAGTPEIFIKLIRKQLLNNALKREDTANELVKIMQGSAGTFGKRKQQVNEQLAVWEEVKQKAAHPALGWVVGGGTGVGVLDLGFWGAITTGYAAYKLQKIVTKKLALWKKRKFDPKLNLEKITQLDNTLKDFDKAWATGDWGLVKPELFEMGLLGKMGFKSSQAFEKFNKWKQDDAIKGMEKLGQKVVRGGDRYLDSTSRPTRALQIRAEHEEDSPISPTPPQEEATDDFGGSSWETETDFGGSDWNRSPQSLEINKLQEPKPAPMFDKDFIHEDPVKGAGGARGTIFEPEENVITTEIEEEVIDPELDDRERRKKRIFSFLKKQGAKIGKKSVV